jgi:hypothetical protein
MQVARSLVFIGYHCDLPSKTSRDPHVTPQDFYLWESHTYKPCSSTVYKLHGFLAEHGSRNQALDAVT